MYDVSLAMALPMISLAVLVLVPIGAFAYLLFEKLGISQAPSTAPGEPTTKEGGNLYFRDH